MKITNIATCAECGSSESLELACNVVWDHVGRRPHVEEILDKGHYCGICDKEVSLTWVAPKIFVIDEGSKLDNKDINYDY